MDCCGAKMISSESNTNGNLSLSGVNGTISDFKSSALTVELELHKKEMVVKAMFASPLAGSVAAQQLDLPDLVATIDANSSGAADGLHGNLKGALQWMAWPKMHRCSLMEVGRQRYQRESGSKRFSSARPQFFGGYRPTGSGSLSATPAKAAKGRKFTKKVASAKRVEESLDLSLFDDLKDLKIQGSIRIGVLKATNVTSSGVKLDIRTGQYRDRH